MTGSRAIAQFTDRVERIRILVLLVRIWTKVTCMTARAVRLVRRRWPRNRFRVASVAIRTRELFPMVARVSRRRVSEQQRFPGVRRVTSIAVLAGDKMPGWFALGGGSVVAA